MVYEPVLSGTPHTSCSQYVVGTTQSYVPVVGCWPLIRVMTLPEEFGSVSHSATTEPLGAFCALHEIRSVCPSATDGNRGAARPHGLRKLAVERRHIGEVVDFCGNGIRAGNRVRMCRARSNTAVLLRKCSVAPI